MCGISPDDFWPHLALSIGLATVCALAGIIALRLAKTGHVSLFGSAIDPDRRLQRAFGCLGIFAAAATLICPFLPHAALPAVHGTIGWVCIITALVLVPRLFYGIVMQDAEPVRP